MPLTKYSWTWRDIATELGISFAIDAALIAGGVAVGGAAAVAALPVTISILGGAALTMGIWYLTRQMDDNINDLVDRLEDLDPNQQAAGIVSGWIAYLKQKQLLLDASTGDSSQDERSRAVVNAQRYSVLKEVHSYMEKMWNDWHNTVKPNLTDLAFDTEQAEYAISNTLSAIAGAKEEIKVLVQEKSNKVIREMSESTGFDYVALAKQIVALHNKLTELANGIQPTYEGDEIGAWKLARYLAGDGDLVALSQQDLRFGKSLMLELKDKMERGVKQLSSRANAKSLISKRALILGDGSRVIMPGQTLKKKVEAPPKTISRRDVSTRTICNPEKRYPNDTDILSCLKGYFKITDPETEQKRYAYNWLASFVDSYGRRLVSDRMMIEWIKAQFPIKTMKPSEWSPAQFVTFVTMTPQFEQKAQQTEKQKNIIPQFIKLPTNSEQLLLYMRNYLFVITTAGGKQNVYYWLKRMGMGEYLMSKLMNEFTSKYLRDRVWDSATSPKKFKNFIYKRLAGRAGNLRLL